MKIFVTNLETSKDRRLFMEQQFSRLKIDFEFIDCVVGAKLSEEDVQQHCDMEAINRHNEKIVWFNRGIIGCTMTNQNTYRRIVADKIDYALLLEDDTILPKDLDNILADIERTIRPGDVILLFYMSWEPLILKQTEIASATGYRYYEPENPKVISGGSAMIVTKEAAAKMLDLNTPIHSTPDCWGEFYERGGIDRLLCLYPLCIDTADFKSTMQLGGLKQFSKFVDKYKVFPIYQLLKMRRNYQKRIKQKIQFK